jgi:hypothetical protein
VLWSVQKDPVYCAKRFFSRQLGIIEGFKQREKGVSVVRSVVESSPW